MATACSLYNPIATPTPTKAIFVSPSMTWLMLLTIPPIFVPIEYSPFYYPSIQIVLISQSPVQISCFLTRLYSLLQHTPVPPLSVPAI